MAEALAEVMTEVLSVMGRLSEFLKTVTWAFATGPAPCLVTPLPCFTGTHFLRSRPPGKPSQRGARRESA